MEAEKIVSELFERLKDANVVKEYQEQKRIISEYPELKQQIDDFREKSFMLQQKTNGNELYEEIDHFMKEYEEFVNSPLVHEFLDKEVAYCKFIQRIRDRFLEEVSRDFV